MQAQNLLDLIPHSLLSNTSASQSFHHQNNAYVPQIAKAET
jgi:hypothetical protein